MNERIDYSAIERQVCAYLSLYPDLSKDITTDSLEIAKYIDFIELVIVCNKSSPERITYDVALSVMNSDSFHSILIPSDIENIMSVAQKSANLEREEIRKLLSASLSRLKDRKNTQELIKSLQDAIYFAKTGDEAQAVSIARSINFSRNTQLKETITHMMESVNEGSVFRTGIRHIDQNMGGLCKGNILSIVGDTGSMKTMVTLWMSIKVLKENPKFTALYFEKEMPARDIARRLASMLSQRKMREVMQMNSVEIQRLIGESSVKEGMEAVFDAISRLTIVPHDYFKNSIDMHMLIDKYKPDIWTLDFMTQLEGLNSTGGAESFNMNVLKEANRLKSICNSTNTLGIIINQTGKNTVTRRPNKIPMKDDMEWSGTVSQVSAYIFGTFYPAYYYKTQYPSQYFYLIGCKNRHESLVNIPLFAFPDICSFKEPNVLEEGDIIQTLRSYIETKKNA